MDELLDMKKKIQIRNKRISLFRITKDVHEWGWKASFSFQNLIRKFRHAPRLVTTRESRARFFPVAKVFSEVSSLLGSSLEAKRTTERLGLGACLVVRIFRIHPYSNIHKSDLSNFWKFLHCSFVSSFICSANSIIV